MSIRAGMAKCRSRFHAAIDRTVKRELTVNGRLTPRRSVRPAYALPFRFGRRSLR